MHAHVKLLGSVDHRIMNSIFDRGSGAWPAARICTIRVFDQASELFSLFKLSNVQPGLI